MSSRLWRSACRLLGRVFVLLIVLSIAGAVYQWLNVRAEAGRYPPPGTLVDIGGRRLHLICIGELRPGEPTVIFESSGFGGALRARAKTTAHIDSDRCHNPTLKAAGERPVRGHYLPVNSG
jgi:hypothetical protein